MTIEIKIPQNIINKCTQSGWDEQEIKKHFATYMSEVINQPYFEQDFQVWLEDLDEEELNEQAEEVAEGLTIEDLRGKRFISKDYIRPIYVVGSSKDDICTIEWITQYAGKESITYRDAQVEHYFNTGTWILFE